LDIKGLNPAFNQTKKVELDCSHHAQKLLSNTRYWRKGWRDEKMVRKT